MWCFQYTVIASYHHELAGEKKAKIAVNTYFRLCLDWQLNNSIVPLRYIVIRSSKNNFKYDCKVNLENRKARKQWFEQMTFFKDKPYIKEKMRKGIKCVCFLRICLSYYKNISERVRRDRTNCKEQSWNWNRNKKHLKVVLKQIYLVSGLKLSKLGERTVHKSQKHRNVRTYKWASLHTIKIEPYISDADIHKTAWLLTLNGACFPFKFNY